MDSSPPPIRVVKIGGSLLEFDRTPIRLREWLTRQSPMRTVWIVGGGKLVDEMRCLDQSETLDAMELHSRCIELMDVNLNRVANWFPNWRATDHLDELAQQRLPVNWLLSSSDWVRLNARHLPASWDVTSDSIAATIAMTIGATELVLLKSCTAPPQPTVKTLIESNYVDGYFQTALNGESMSIPPCESEIHPHQPLVRLVNLRTSLTEESTLAWPSTRDRGLHQLFEIEPPDFR